jgi:hypothetical protein
MSLEHQVSQGPEDHWEGSSTKVLDTVFLRLAVGRKPSSLQVLLANPVCHHQVLIPQKWYFWLSWTLPRDPFNNPEPSCSDTVA